MELKNKNVNPANIFFHSTLFTLRLLRRFLKTLQDPNIMCNSYNMLGRVVSDLRSLIPRVRSAPRVRLTINQPDPGML